jgi:hypothetical protein
MDLGTYRGNAEVACCSFLYSLWDASDSDYGSRHRDPNRDRDRNRRESKEFDPDSDFDCTDVLAIRIAERNGTPQGTGLNGAKLRGYCHLNRNLNPNPNLNLNLLVENGLRLRLRLGL